MDGRTYRARLQGMTLPLYRWVKLKTDRFRDKGAVAGDLGVVIEAWGGGAYEVEFFDDSGTNYAELAASEEDLELLPDDEQTSKALRLRNHPPREPR
jgi:hypothetical protein